MSVILGRFGVGLADESTLDSPRECHGMGKMIDKQLTNRSAQSYQGIPEDFGCGSPD
jgi:hypothetical protein